MRTGLFHRLKPGAASALLLLMALPAAAQPFARHVAPFPVRDRAGTLLLQPFVGGFDTPRPAVGDLTGDALPDVLVVEQAGAAMLFENRSATGAPVFVWRTDFFGGIDAGEWLRLFDGDGDGDLDVLAQFGFTHLRYFRNDGGTFTLALDTLRDASGAPVDRVEAQNLPGFGDVTCDGRPDLLAGQIDGTLTVYPALPPQNGRPRFGTPIERFGGIFVEEAVNKTATPLHGASTVETGDVDADGDTDILWGNFFSDALILIENTTGCPTPVFERALPPFPTEAFSTSGYNTAAWADLDGDGLGDLLTSSLGGAYASNDDGLYTDVFYLFAGTPGGFAQQTRRFGSTLDVGTMSRVAAGDLDGDGDADLLVSTQVDSTRQRGGLFAWENTGTRTAPAFAPRPLVLPAPLPFGPAPALGDLDGDGDLDLLIGAFDGSVTALRATGPFAFEPFPNLSIRIPRGSNATPALGDLDGDGDLDLLVGENSGYVNVYRNDGTAHAPAFTLVTEALVVRPGANITPALADLDGDGDLDLYMGTQRDGFVVFRNSGTARAYAFSAFEAFLGPTDAARLPYEAAPTFADLDGDGDLDLFSGTKSGGVMYYENTRLASSVEAEGPSGAGALADLGPFPNPSSEGVVLRFALARAGRVEACAFDLLGRRVACAPEAFFEAGAHALPVPLADAPAGVYVYRLRAGGHVATGTLVRQP